MNEFTQGIQKYNPSILPKKSGETIYVEDIGSAMLGDEFDVELILGIYRIIKK